MSEDRAFRRLIYILAAVIGILVGLLIALGIRYARLSQFEPLAEMAATIEKNYYYYDAEAGEDALIDASLRGMVEKIDDPYSAYYTQEEYDALLTSHSGEYSGIGIRIALPDDVGAKIEIVYSDSSMAEAGAKAGDIIVRVNGSATANLTLDAVIALFHGDSGASDELVLLRDGVEFSVTVERRTVRVPYTHYEMLPDGIGYVRIDSFLGNVVEETEQALSALLDAGMQSLVLDLRNDPGGGLTEVLAIADLFLKKDDLIVTIRSRAEKEQVYRAKDDGYTVPMAVLVNGSSASASELLTGALKDNGRAVIVGTQTFGKGIVQSYFRLNSNSGWVKITTDAYFTPSGVCIHGAGITPDVVCEQVLDQPIDQLPHGDDIQLQQAIARLTENMK